MTFENTCERLQLALQYSDTKLIDFLYSWIRPNIQHICKTPGFDLLSKDEFYDIFKEDKIAEMWLFCFMFLNFKFAKNKLTD